MPDPISSRPTPWTAVILVCGKCSRKLGGGFGPKQRDALRYMLNDGLREMGARRRVRIIEAKCFGVCPKKAVMALNASQPGCLLTIPCGTEAMAVLRLMNIAQPEPITVG